MQDAIRQSKTSFFYAINEKERKLCKKKRRRGKRGRGSWRGEGRGCLTFFKGIINSMSALVLSIFQ